MKIVRQDEARLYDDFLALIAELECGRHYDAGNPQHVAWLRHRVASLYMAGGTAICMYDDDGAPVGFLLLVHDRGLEGVRCFGNAGAMRFYVKHGFVPVAYHPGENGLGDRGQVYLYKELA